MITIDALMDKYNQIPKYLKKCAQKYGNRAHVKTQPNYRNPTNLYFVTPKQCWFMSVHLAIRK